MKFDNNIKKSYDFRMKIIRCRTEEEAKELLRIAKRQGFKWINGQEYDENNTQWTVYREDTVYFIYDGQFGNVITEQCQNEAIEFKDFIKNYEIRK